MEKAEEGLMYAASGVALISGLVLAFVGPVALAVSFPALAVGIALGSGIANLGTPSQHEEKDEPLSALMLLERFAGGAIDPVKASLVVAQQITIPCLGMLLIPPVAAIPSIVAGTGEHLRNAARRVFAKPRQPESTLRPEGEANRTIRNTVRGPGKEFNSRSPDPTETAAPYKFDRPKDCGSNGPGGMA